MLLESEYDGGRKGLDSFLCGVVSGGNNWCAIKFVGVGLWFNL